MDKVFYKLLNRPTDSDKFSFGHVLVVGGSAGMVGAPLLAATAALRTGAGLVTIASSRAVTDKLDGRQPELMTHAFQTAEDVTSFIQDRNVSVLLVGSGMVTDEAGGQLLRELVGLGLPTVLDAGVLQLVAKDTALLDSNDNLVLTPHPGEFRRLLGTELPDDQAAVIDLAQGYAARRAITLVLKTQPNHIFDAAGKMHTNTTGSPALATAGTGDVLAGMVAAVIAQGIKPYDAAVAAVHLHGLAGEIVGSGKTQPGMIASDVVANIPTAFKQLQLTQA